MMKRLGIGVMMILIVLASSCPMHPDEIVPTPLPYERDGSTLLQMKEYIYLIGGIGDRGTQVLRKPASLENMEESEWISCTNLPFPRAFGAVFPVGNRIYLVGGEDNDGIPMSTIHHAYVFEDGSLGTWSSFGSQLPYPLSRMGYTYHDGRIFLFGGIGSDGIPAKTILHARIAPDTRVGAWYESTETLHTPLVWSSAHVVTTSVEKSIIIVAGGIDPAGNHSSITTLFELQPQGKLTLYGQISNPLGLSSPIIAPEEDGFLLIGGIKEDGIINSMHHIYSFGTKNWHSDQIGLPSTGTHAFTIEGTLCAVQEYGNKLELFKGTTVPALPKVFPGSGLIPPDTVPSVQGEHGSKISQSGDGILWEPIEPITISKEVLFKSELGDRISNYSTSDYTVVPYGFMVNLEGYLPIQNVESDPFTDIYTTSSTLWYGFGVSDTSKIELTWKDYTSHPSQYDGTIEISMREIDLYNEILDENGFAIRERTGTAASPLLFSIPSGQYLVKIDFSTGSNAAIRLRRL